jgi:hypothetical protein
MEPRADADSNRTLRNLLQSLTRELFQTETSAVRHCRREAERLGHAPPAQTLRELSDQAAGFLRELPGLMKAHGLPVSAGGMGVGEMFSQTRDKIMDRLVRSERSYRGTMLGLRHGVDLMLLYGYASRAAGLAELSAFCERWLVARRPLVSRLEQDLGWFAEEPERAMQFARPLTGSPARRRAPEHRERAAQP